MRTSRLLAAFLYSILLLTMLWTLGACSEEEFSPALTREFGIESNISGAVYPIKVGLPENYNPNEKYATIYVLDGEADFEFVASQCREISARHATQNVLVVGIGYGRDRGIDYTPTSVSSETGGGPEFLNFIEAQLVPRIEEEFNADTTRSGRVILGHSYGGLFGSFALAVGNKVFGNYILLSPSLWFDNEVALVLEKENRGQNQDTHQLVFLGIGDMENSGRMQAPFEAFYQILRANYSDISLGKARQANLAHTGSKNPNIIDGLNFYFQNR